MKVVILAHGGHILMALMPVTAVVYLYIAMRDTPKRTNAGTRTLPTHPFSRQIHAAISPPKAKPAAPVPATFMPSRARKRERGPRIVVPLHLQAPPKSGPDSSSSTAQNP